MENTPNFYIPDFIPRISPVKKGALVRSKMSREMKLNLDRELATRQLEFQRLRKIKQNERECIGKFQQYFSSKQDSQSKSDFGGKTNRQEPLPTIVKDRSPFIRELLEIDYYTLKGKRFNSEKKRLSPIRTPTGNNSTNLRFY